MVNARVNGLGCAIHIVWVDEDGAGRSDPQPLAMGGDHARRTMQGNTQYRLARLDDLDGYKVADGEPDPRGWDVRAADGRTVGALRA